MLIPRGTTVGNYRVEGILGRGGMAVVYSARHNELGREAALKVLGSEESGSPQFVERFRREGRLQASFEHPHAVSVYEAGESEHGLYLAMQLIPGASLALLLAERAVDAQRALTLLGQVADALDAAHAAGLVHRDVKPQNVLVGEHDDAYLADFGLVRLGGATGVTVTGTLIGTVAYLAPEVILGAEATAAADRYAFAAMAFECLAGGPVFPRPTTAAILHSHTAEPPPRISARRPALPGALDAVFSGALAKDPSARPASARAFVDAVQAALGDGIALGPPEEAAALDPGTIEPLPAPTAAPAPARRSRTGLVAGVAALAGAALALGVYAIADNGDEKPAAPAAPVALAGAQVLGSDLAQPGRTRDCRGHAPVRTSPQCTILQTRLAGHTLVVPRDGVIRRWGVRSARGELSLAVLRPRGAGAFQVARSQNEFVANDGISLFPTDLAVERGDRIGVVVLGGSGIGVRDGAGAATERWIPHLGDIRPPELGPGTGYDDELLLRVDYVAGGQPRQPDQVIGPAARQLPAGHDVAKRSVRFKDGHHIEMALVAVGGKLFLEERVDGRRFGRVAVPDWVAGGRVLTYHVSLDDDTGQEAGTYIEYAEEDSNRILAHYIDATLQGFELVN